MLKALAIVVTSDDLLKVPVVGEHLSLVADVDGKVADSVELPVVVGAAMAMASAFAEGVDLPIVLPITDAVEKSVDFELKFEFKFELEKLVGLKADAFIEKFGSLKIGVLMVGTLTAPAPPVSLGAVVPLSCCCLAYRLD